MIELAKVSDPVRLSFLCAVLDDARLAYAVLDDQLASVFGAALGVRLMVADEDLPQARRVLAAAEAGLEPS
jgi:hypothetical protein